MIMRNRLYCIICWHDYPRYLRIDECMCGGAVVLTGDGQELPDMLHYKNVAP